MTSSSSQHLLVPVLVEPSSLAYDASRILRQVPKPSARDFAQFTRELATLFDQLEKSDVSIAGTRTLIDLLRSQVPYADLSGQPGYMAMVSEVFQRRLPNLMSFLRFKRQDPVTILAGLADPNGLLQLDATYGEWGSLLALIPRDQLPPVVIHNASVSLFPGPQFTLTTSTAPLPLTVDLIDKPSTLVRGIALWRLVQASLTAERIDACACKGTGDHSCMFGNKRIRTISDVPAPERELLVSLFDTRLVSEITFLTFNEPFPPEPKPYIELRPQIEDAGPNLISARLRGSGTKQNAQRLALKIVDEAIPFFRAAFGSQISVDDLSRFSRVHQAEKTRLAM